MLLAFRFECSLCQPPTSVPDVHYALQKPIFTGMYYMSCAQKESTLRSTIFAAHSKSEAFATWSLFSVEDQGRLELAMIVQG